MLAYKYFLEADDKTGLARALLNLGETSHKLGNYRKSIEYGKEALFYNNLSNQLAMNGIVYLNIGNTYLKQNKLDSAVNYYELSMSSTKKWGNSFNLAKSKQGLAKVYAQKNDFLKAIKHAIESYQIADKTTLSQVKAEAANLLAIYYSKLGDYKKAVSFKNIEAEINDSIFNEEKYKVQNEMEAMYQSQKKEQQITTLSKEKEIEVLKNQQSKYYIFSLIGLLIVLSAVGVLIFRNNRLNAKRNAIELEQRLLRSQMNPHFIFNAISCIQEYIMDKKPLEAGSYLSNFAKLMRSILNNSATEFISVEDEIETLKHYLQLQQMRFPDKLEYEIIAPENMEVDELAIPPMLAQPFIENAIKHGIAKKESGTGKVTIEFAENKGSILLNIQDDGVGIDAMKTIKDRKHKSMATQITQNRISNFKNAYKKKVNFEIGNVMNEKMEVKGTKVSFVLPKKMQ